MAKLCRAHSRSDEVLNGIGQSSVVRRYESRIAAPPLTLNINTRRFQEVGRIAAQQSLCERIHVDRIHPAAILYGQTVPSGVLMRSSPDPGWPKAEGATLVRCGGRRAADCVEEQAVLEIAYFSRVNHETARGRGAWC